MELLFWCLDAKIQHIPPLASLIRMLVRHMHKNVKKKNLPYHSQFTRANYFLTPIFLGNKHLLPIKYKKNPYISKKPFLSLRTGKNFPFIFTALLFVFFFFFSIRAKASLKFLNSDLVAFCLRISRSPAMSRYDSNPFEEEEVNPFAVSFALFCTRVFWISSFKFDSVDSGMYWSLDSSNFVALFAETLCRSRFCN